jgi:hypothetical protein
MWKSILAVIAGLAVWTVIASIAGVVLRVSWPAYAQVAGAMAFNLPMMIARLSIGALATVAAGLVTAVIARSAIVGIVPGVLLLVMFIPEHVSLLDKFPIWYHLTFLLSLVPLTYAGSKLAERGSPSAPVGA